MSDQHSSAEAPDRNRSGTFIAVVLVEALVILALWAFSAHFGG